MVASASANRASGIPSISDGPRRGDGHLESARIREPDVLGGRDHEAPRDEPGVLAALHHAGHPEQRGVRLRPADALDERRRDVVVRVPVVVVPDDAPAQALRRRAEVDPDDPVPVRRRGEHRQLERRERLPGVAERVVREVVERVVRHGRVVFAEAALGVGESGPEDRENVVPRQGLELEHLDARQKRLIQVEEGVLDRGADHDERVVLEGREQHVLLGLVEPVHLVDEGDGAPGGRAGAPPPRPRGGRRRPPRPRSA